MSSTSDNILSLKRITVGYPGIGNLLEKIDTDIRRGEMVALIGRNGSGKSTLLRTIARLQKQKLGKVIIGGRLHTGIPYNEFARTLAYVESGSSLTENLTVYELVSIGRHPYTNWWGTIREEDHLKIMESIRFVGMENFIEIPVTRLSDGERQRVMIARALAQETSILVLDEPTAFLDLPNKFGIIGVLNRLRDSGKSILYSTHDLETAFLFADKCWVIENKEITEGGVEDLGINSIFSHLFKDSNLHFDESEMKFTPIRASRGKIFLGGDDERATIWTSRMLERLGFEITGVKSDNYPAVTFNRSGDTYGWTINYAGNSSEFISLYDMAYYLSHLK